MRFLATAPTIRQATAKHVEDEKKKATMESKLDKKRDLTSSSSSSSASSTLGSARLAPSGSEDCENSHLLSSQLKALTITKKKEKTAPTTTNIEEENAENVKRPYFCYLMDQLGGPCKNEAKIIVTRECFQDTYCHNSGEINDKGTKAARGRWQVEMVVGPFHDKQEAEHCKQLWVRESRGIEPRRKRIIQLVKKNIFSEQVRCYDKRLVPLDLNKWLEENNMACLVIPEGRLASFYYDCAQLSKKHEEGGFRVA